MKKLLLVIVCTILISCKFEGIGERRYTIIVSNNSNHSIVFHFAFGGLYDGGLYPDTLLPQSCEYIYREIKASGKYYYYSSAKWEEIYSNLPCDTMSVFIFHTDTLNKYSWQEVRDGYKILRRYDLSLEDIKKMKWTIPYPPDESMAGMKMYPPYQKLILLAYMQIKGSQIGM